MKGKFLFFTSLAVFSIGVGFLLSAAKENAKAAKAEEYTVEYNGGYVNIGSYPQSLVRDNAIIEALNNLPTGGDKVEYNGKYYSEVNPCEVYAGGVMVADGVFASAIDGYRCWFAWDSILWHEVSIDSEQNVTYFVSDIVLDAMDYQSNVSGDYITGTEINANDYENSSIRAFLDGDFYFNAFTDDEKTAALPFKLKAKDNVSNKDLNQEYATIPTKSQLKGKTALLNAKGSAYAIAKSLYFNLDGSEDSMFYYLNSIENNPNSHTKVDCATQTNVNGSEDVKVTNNNKVTTVRKTLGVRPVIAIDNNKLIKRTGGNGGGGRGGYVNVPLIIGIVITIVGGAGVVVFFILWGKHLVTFSFKYLPLIIIIICIVITCTGLIMIFANTGGVGSGYLQSSPVGYYSTTEFTLDVNSKNFGYRFHLGLTSDHKVYRYYGDTVESARNYTLHPYPGVGTWQLRGKKLIISAPQTWELFRWELQETTYYATTIMGFAKDGMLMNENDSTFEGYQVKGYRWYHSTTVEPTGEAVTMKEAGYNTSNWVSAV